MRNASKTTLGLAVLAIVMVAAAIAPGSAAAEPGLLRQFCEEGTAGGQCNLPRGVAVDQATGNAFVADQESNRIDEFTAWGEFLRTWGWDVVASGPGDDTTAPEDQLEICLPADGDVCKAGISGAGVGQLSRPQGLAVDSAGDVYVVDRGIPNNGRVQKFDSEGHFLLMFGGDVNKTKVEASAPPAERNLCPVAPGDVCQAGTEGTGNGQFSGGFTAGSYIAVAPGPPERVYVGDGERIQIFDTGGDYVGEIAAGALAGETVLALAVDPLSGDPYVALRKDVTSGQVGKENVLKLDPATGNVLAALKVKEPMAVTVDGDGNAYVFDNSALSIFVKGPPILKFGPGGSLIESFGQGAFANSTGLAASQGCGLDSADLFAANSSSGNSFVRVYGPPPDPEICTPPSLPPTISSQHALSVGTEDATVRAKVNPHFWADTRYYVEYGTVECTDAVSCEHKALFPGSLLGGGVIDGDVATAGVSLGGLSPDTTYHYRFVAESAKSGAGPTFGEGEGHTGGSFHTYPPSEEPLPCAANQAFRTGAGARLPDCRAYEMVSPVDKNNGDVAVGFGTLAQAAPDGSRVTFSSFRAFAEPVSAPLLNQYLAERDPAQGWLTRSISPPGGAVPLNNEYLHSRFKAFTPDLCSGWVVQDVDVPLADGAPADVPNVYRRRNCDPGAGSYELLSSVAPPGFDRKVEPESEYWPSVGGFSADGSHTVFQADAALTPDACTTPEKEIFQVYESTGGGAVRLVSAVPNGQAACTHSSTGTKGSDLGTLDEDSLYHAVSTDGTRVFWTASESSNPVSGGGGSGDQPGRIYLRLNSTQPQSEIVLGKCAEPEKACTVQVSKGESHFVAADPEGKTAIYVVGSLENSEAELFEFNLNEGDPGKSKSTLIAKGVTGIMGASEDATRVYFASKEVLSGETNSEGAVAAPGKPNLYLYRRGDGFAFVGTLAKLDVQFGNVNGRRTPSPVSLTPSLRTAQVSPDGLHAAFTSSASLTGYDNLDRASGEPDAEVFVYDAGANAGTGEVACISCNFSGSRPAGRDLRLHTISTIQFWNAARMPGWKTSLHAGNFISPDGERLFFESFDALLPRDTNGRVDVYEWERAAGKAACRELGAELYVPSAGGCISLISSGQSPHDSSLIDASGDGSDVFFATSSSLLPQDPGLVDVYDARVGGGFPSPEPPAPSCEGEACQGAASLPDDPSPASAAFLGAGNFKPGSRQRHCPKGKRRRHGRCVRLAHRAKKHHRRAASRRRVGR